MNEPLLELIRAIDFVARKHSLQRRKGSLREPYVNHVIEVSCLLAEACRGDDLTLIIGGVLHDTVEDTGTSVEELRNLFGDEVAELVEEVTDDRSLSRSTRRELQVRNARRKSERARMIKIADKTSNLRSLLFSPPQGWDRARKTEYAEWARTVVQECRGVSPELEGQFASTYKELLSSLSGGPSESQSESSSA